MRADLEPGFGRDFAGVRVHDDAHAARSAAAIGAEAYAAGSHIVFGRGAWAPHTSGGRKLIAHELAHVTQQPAATGRAQAIGGRGDAEEATAEAAAARVVAGLPAPALRTASPGVIRRTTGPSTYRNDVNVGSVHSTGATTEGTVHRQEFDAKGVSIHDATARVRTTFSPKVCAVTIPFDVKYQAVPTAADLSKSTTVAGQAPPSARPSAKTRPLFDHFLGVVSRGLSDWFNVRIGPCPDQPCADRDIPIEVVAREATSNPQLTVAFVAGEGRSYVSGDGTRMVLIGGDAVSDHTLVHEAGHGALGHGDEYIETSLGVRSPDRERTSDMSMMSAPYYRNAVFHERHFAHVREFVSHVVNRGRKQPCTVTLKAVPHTQWDFGIDMQVGYLNLNGGSGGGLGLGLGLNVGASSRDSRTRFSFGPQATMLAQLSGVPRAAFLLGSRIGLQRRTALPGGGLSYGGHVEGGVSLGDAPRAPYLGIGGRIGYSGGAYSEIFSGFVEAAAGTGLNLHDPDVMRYVFLGIGGSVSF